jgi:hypothetical protein
MKPCPNCRSTAPDDAEVCAVCGWDFVAGVRDEVSGRSENERVDRQRPRPTGKTAIAISLLLGGLALLLLLCSLFVTTERYGEIDVEGIAFQWMLQVCAGSLFYLALLIGLAGYIVRALSYLPGHKGR